MNKEVLDFVVEKTKELMAAPSCSQEAKEAAQSWLDAVGTDRQEAYSDPRLPRMPLRSWKRTS